jgi:hypothetical protein
MHRFGITAPEHGDVFRRGKPGLPRAGKFMEKVCLHAGYVIHLDNANLEIMHRAGSHGSEPAATLLRYLYKNYRGGLEEGWDSHDGKRHDQQ